jgi:hypothetical protein
MDVKCLINDFTLKRTKRKSPKLTELILLLATNG